MKPRLLDLFCGAGGCSMGYARAGFDVEGVDHEPHPDYPFRLYLADVMDVLAIPELLAGYDVVHASPPCPVHSTITRPGDHPDLLEPVREALKVWGGLYVIENVPPRAARHLESPLMVCGAAFGLGIDCRDGVWRPLRRHRLFESNAPLMSSGCMCSNRQAIGVYGHGGGTAVTRTPKASNPTGHKGGYKATNAEARRALGVEWMTRREDVSDAIPPAYTQALGEQLLAYLPHLEGQHLLTRMPA